jgi:Flp pilus assembly protein TadD
VSKTQKTASGKERIDSWKEIAAFFERDERTVKRWEKERALPIHRIPGERGGVFAYTGELTDWLNSTRPDKRSEDEPGIGIDKPGIDKPGTDKPGADGTRVAVGTVPQRRSTDQAASPSTPVMIHPPYQDNSPVGPLADLKANPQIPATKTPSSFHRRIRIWAVAAGILVCVLLFAAYRLQQTHGASAPAKKVTPALSGHTPTPEAQELYLKGRYYWNHRTEGSLKQAVDAFTQAVVHDSNYAPAYAGLADSYNLMPEYTSMPKSEAFPRAIASAQKAVALDDSLSEAHRALAFGLFYWEWNVDRALREYQKAIELDPKDVEAHHWYATALLSLDRLPEARAEIVKARALDPTSRAILGNEAFINFWAGDRDASVAKMRELERSEPDFLSPPRYLSRMLFFQRDFPGYIAQAKRAAEISGDPQEMALAQAAARGWAKGGEHEMLEQMRIVQQKTFDSGQASGFDLARTCALLGRKQEADLYFQAALKARDYMMMSIIGKDSDKQMRGDPEFEKLRQQVSARMSRPTSPEI